MQWQHLECALCSLDIVAPSAALAKDFQDPKFNTLTGRDEPFDLDVLRTMLEEETEMVVWKITHTDTQKAVGYAMLVLFNGPPFFCYKIDGDEEFAFNLTRDCLTHMVPLFFELMPEERTLHFYLGPNVPEHVHDELVENGFDHDEDNLTINHSTTTPFVMWRETYEAYYGEGTEEEFEEY